MSFASLDYGIETMTLTVKSANRLRTTQRAIERTMLGISLRNHIQNEEIRKRTVDDVTEHIASIRIEAAREGLCPGVDAKGLLKEEEEEV